MSRCVIVSACPVEAELKSLLRTEDLLIACDAGYRNCAALGRMPDIVVGDFDSAPCPAAAPGEDLVVLPHVKDDTDTEYAAKLARRQGADEVLMLGALGGNRLEHTLSNLSTGLALERDGVRVTLQNAMSRITYVLPGHIRRYPREDYFYFSIFPLEGAAEGVELHGTFYELADATLTARNFSLTTSNEYAAGSNCITVSSRRGALLVIETLADHQLDETESASS